MSIIEVADLWQSGATLALAALAIEASFGYPKALFAKIGHPVTWIGAAISFADMHNNLTTRSPWVRANLGALSAITIVGLVAIVAIFIAWSLPNTFLGFGLEATIASSLLASRSLYDHVAAVSVPLVAGDLTAARQKVAQIVGRETSVLDEAGVARAGLESLAENASDGVIAPLLWCALLGLPGLAAYKAINTLDSMIGHRTPQYESFGGFAARLDDVANWIPARLSGFAFALVGDKPFQVITIMVSDAPKHRSPNAGWPEAAMAASLGVRLSGPRIYHDTIADEPWLNANGRDAAPGDLGIGLRIYVRMIALVALGLLLISVGILYG